MILGWDLLGQSHLNLLLYMMLTKIQKDIVEGDLGPMLVTAGAGSGKTRVLTGRIAFLLDMKDDLGMPRFRDYEVLALTFTNKAASEMRERIEKMRGEAIQTFLGTFHSFCVRTLRRYIEELGLGFTKNFSIYDTSDSLKVIKEVLEAKNYSTLNNKDSAKTVQWHLGNWKNEGKSLLEYREEIKQRDEADDVIKAIEEYQKKLIKNNALDFDDLLVRTLELFNKAPHVLEHMQRRYKFILVDEFQDTNVVQYQIVRMLGGMHKNVMVVGDEDQCIYTWRGASSKNIKLFCKDFEPRIFKLEQNFRSSCNIVKLANDLISHNTERLDKVLFSELAEGDIDFDAYYDDKEEARKVVQQILLKNRAGVKLSDMAILLRVNALSRIFEDELRACGFGNSYVIWGGFKFYDRAEVKNAIHWLRLLANRNDEVALSEAIAFPKRGVGDSSFQKIKEYSTEKNVSLFEALEGVSKGELVLPAKAKQGVISFLLTLDKLIELYEDNTLEELGREFTRISGLEQAYKLTGKPEDESRLKNLEELVNVIVQYATENPEATLDEYLQTATLSSGHTPDATDQLVISTIHSSKGLEFKEVFIAGLEDGIFPLERAKDSFAELEEERRLLYVAITRAKRGLHLSYAKTRFHRGERKWQKPSQFLKECDLVEEEPEPKITSYGNWWDA